MEVSRGCGEADELFRAVAGESSKMVALMISSNVVSKVVLCGQRLADGGSKGLAGSG